MKRLISLVIAISVAVTLAAQQPAPRGYAGKTAKLAENLVKYSKDGDYNKTYNALRDIQKFEYRLGKEQLVKFYSDLHDAVDKACDKYGIEDAGKKEMEAIVDALFSDELKAEVNNKKED